MRKIPVAVERGIDRNSVRGHVMYLGGQSIQFGFDVLDVGVQVSVLISQLISLGLVVSVEVANGLKVLHGTLKEDVEFVGRFLLQEFGASALDVLGTRTDDKGLARMGMYKLEEPPSMMTVVVAVLERQVVVMGLGSVDGPFLEIRARSGRHDGGL